MTNLLLVGPSAVGKSTLLKRVGQAVRPLTVRGFYSESLWEQGERVGWRLDTFDGTGGVLARRGAPSAQRMGRYGVDMSLFDRLVDSQLRTTDDEAVYLIDEIGIIASWSPMFIEAMTALLESPAPVVAIARQRAGGLASVVTQRDDVDVWEVTLGNRESLVSEVLAWIDQRSPQR